MIHLICPNPALDRTILVDKIEKNIPIRPLEVRDYPGGKGFNVAYALKENGITDVRIHTILGGRIGQYIQDLNEERGNHLSFIEVPKTTRTCSIFVEKVTGDVELYYEKGLELSQELFAQFNHQLEESLEDGDWVVFSGSLMKGMPDDYIAHFIDEHPQVKVVVDTSGPALQAAYDTHPTLIKINNEELKELYPELDEQSPAAILEILKEKTPHENLIITMGAKGSLAKIGRRFFFVKSPKIQARNPIASGDFYLGLLVKGLSQGDAPQDYLRAASAFSTANCLNDFPEVKEEDFQRILAEVELSEL